MDRNNLKLTPSEIKLFKINKSKNEDKIQITGKPKTNFKDFLSRLFSRKTTIIALSFFLLTIIFAIIVTYTSNLSPQSTILLNDGSAPKNFLISNLTPTLSNGGKHKLIVSVSQFKILQDLQESGLKIISYNVESPDRILVIINPYEYFNSDAFIGDDKIFILGTNSQGQDNWVRIWAGTLESLKLAILVAVAETFIGVVIGAYLGFHAGSKIDNILMRIIDTISGVPTLLWFILLSFILKPGFWTLFASLTAIGWIAPVYQTRMYTLRVKNLDFIKAAKTIGVPKWKLIYKYGLPQSLGRILSQFVRRIPIVIFAQASLAFLGFSNADDFNLGAIINDAKSHLENIWYLLTPTLIIFSITLSLQFVANGINDALEPKIGGK